MLEELRQRLKEAARSRRQAQRRAFVLSGGGNLGAVQVGMLRALVEFEIVPDVIVGCSVGAINGAAFAAEPSIRGVHRLERIWGRMEDSDPDIMPNRGLLPFAVQMARKGLSVHSQDELRELLSEELVVSDFESLQIPFACVAGDLDTASEYWFDHGDLVPALLASSALPGIFPPVEIDGHRLFDGGVVNEVPVHRAVELGAREIFLLHVGHLDDRAMDEATRPFDVLTHAYWTMRASRLDVELDRLDDSVVLHRLDVGDVPNLRFDDFSKSRALAEEAYQATSVSLSRAIEN